MTVFLTTQYLEEADALADRVGIIDHGKIVAEGTPEQLKAQIGRSTVEAVPADGTSPEAIARIRAVRRKDRRISEECRGAARARRRGPGRDRPRPGRGGDQDRAPRAARAEPRRRLPRQDRRSLEGAAEEEEAEAEAEAREHACSGGADRAPLGASDGTPAGEHHLPVRLPDGPARRQLRRPDPATEIGLSNDSFIAFFLAFPFIQGALFATMNAGTDLARDIQSGFLNRLALTPCAASL